MTLLADRLLLCRRDLGLTQIELAAAAGLSPQYVSNIERGHTTNLGIEAVAALAAALGIHPAYLVGWADTPVVETDDPALNAQGRVDHGLRRSEERLFFQELVQVVDRLDLPQRQRLMELARSWAAEQTAENAYVAAITSLAGADFAARLTGLLDAGASLDDVQTLLDEQRQGSAQQIPSRK